MIARLTGVLRDLRGLTAYVEVGPVWYEILVPTSVAARLPKPGEPVTLFTFAYIDGGLGGSTSHQRLIGFLEAVEREFFDLLTSVSGLGMKRGARAMALPTSEIAQAIEAGDETTLRELPEIGPKTAKKVIAELQGKMGKFALLRETLPTRIADSTAAAAPSLSGTDAAAAARMKHKELVDDVRHVLTTALHYKDTEAARMIDQALASLPKPESSDELLQLIFKQQRQTLASKPT